MQAPTEQLEAGLDDRGELEILSLWRSQSLPLPSSSPLLASMDAAAPMSAPEPSPRGTGAPNHSGVASQQRLSAPLPRIPVVVADIDTQSKLRRLLTSSSGGLAPACTPQLIIQRGPYGSHCKLFDDQSGEALRFLGPDMGSRSHGIARRTPMSDGGAITMRPAMHGLLPHQLFRSALKNTREGHPAWYAPAKARPAKGGLSSQN